MEIRAALGKHFVGFNTGRWDYINSVSDALSWDKNFINPNIEVIVMTYGYMRNYEDRVRRAVNTPDRNGNKALWQGGMEPNIPVGSKEGAAACIPCKKAFPYCNATLMRFRAPRIVVAAGSSSISPSASCFE